MKAANILETIGNTPHIRINRLFGDRAEVWMKSERFQWAPNGITTVVRELGRAASSKVRSRVRCKPALVSKSGNCG